MQSLVAGVADALHAHEPHSAHAAVHEGPVLAGPHVHHPASEAGLLVHQPLALHHVAGLAVGHAEPLLDVLTVVHQLVHLAAEVLPLVDLHPVGTPVLLGGRGALPSSFSVADYQLDFKQFQLQGIQPGVRSYHGDHAAGLNAVAAGAHHALVVGVLAPPQEVLVAHVVVAVVHHEAASLHPAGLAPVQVGGHVGAVAHALVGATLEVPLLVEDDLGGQRERLWFSSREVHDRHKFK